MADTAEKRVTVIMTTEQFEFLRKQAKRSGVNNVSSLVRQIVVNMMADMADA